MKTYLFQFLQQRAGYPFSLYLFQFLQLRAVFPFSLLASLVGIPGSITSSEVGLKISVITVKIKKYKSIIKKIKTSMTK